MSAAMHTVSRGRGPVPRDAGAAAAVTASQEAAPARDRGNLPRREGAGRRLAHSDAAGQLRPAPTSCAAREAANEVRVALGDAGARAVAGACSIVPPDKLAPAVSQPPGHLSREERAEILRRMFADGYTIRSAAQALGWSRDVVRAVARRFGLAPLPSAIEQAIRFKSGGSAQRAAAAKQRRDEAFRRLIESGEHTIASAARVLRIADTTARDIALRLDLRASEEAVKQARHGAKIAESLALAERLRREIARDRITVAEWARRNGYSVSGMRHLAARHGIKAPPGVVSRAKAEAAKHAAEKTNAMLAAKRPPKSVRPKRRTAQPAVTNARAAATPARLDARAKVSAAIRAAIARSRPKPLPTQAEADAAVAAFLARGGTVTRCPDAYAAPVQNGAGRDAEGWVR